MTNRKRPKVRIVIGRVRIMSIGFNRKLRNASTSERTIAVQKVCMWMPGRTEDNAKATTAVIRMRSTKFMLFFCPS
jgi:hypothetical protein